MAEQGRVPKQDHVPEAFACLVEDFLWSMQVERGASPHTIRNYRIDLMDFGRWATRRGFDPLTINHKQARLYLGELDRAQYSRRTLNRRLSSLKSFFSWAVVAGIAPRDPVSVLQGPKNPASLPRKIPVSDMAKILGVYKSGTDPVSLRNQAILELLYASGLRISEASGLSLDQVKLSQGLVSVVGKGDKQRQVPVHNLAIRAMTAYLWHGRPALIAQAGKDACACERFFLSNKAAPMSADSMRIMFKRTLQLAGVDPGYTPHDMRHTFATDLVEGGADLRSVQEMLGHSSLSTTQIYTHVSVAHLKDEHHRSHPRG